jgi:hypothetical protein
VTVPKTATRKKPGRPKLAVKAEPLFTLKGAPAFKEWLDDFAGHCGLKISDTVGQALVYYAEKRKFRPPPKR